MATIAICMAAPEVDALQRARRAGFRREATVENGCLAWSQNAA
jgi:hypothetical protein